MFLPCPGVDDYKSWLDPFESITQASHPIFSTVSISIPMLWTIILYRYLCTQKHR
ncbi:hypothetical protein BDQ17DRAFT_1351037 [Cyathus striatus]|nr:hypothetical protein BDQ17DRAFT_1377211 [Cyathus striatus]KAF9007637.1 hypothetical protein BDQ17DRAFT_1351037 [Cyathus striatus]